MLRKQAKVLVPFIIVFAAIVLGLSLFHNPSANTYQTKDDILSQSDSLQADEENSTSIDKIINTKGIPILYYHSVRPTEDNELIISPEKLKEQLEFLKSEGYQSLSLKEFSEYILNNAPVPEKSVLITFDDGYMDNYANAFPVLKELNMKAVIFCITFKLDGSYYLSNDAIKEMTDYGIDIQSHTVNHDDLSSLNYQDTLTTLKNSKENLESITNSKIYAIAYPYGKFNDNTFDAAKNAGYTLGFITNTGLAKPSDDPLKLKRIYISSEYNLDTFKKLFYDTINS